MSLHTWWLFVVATFLLSATPGPNMLHVMSRSVDCGIRRTLPVMLGCLCAVLLVLLAAAAGLAALLAAAPGFFEILRLIGVLYLVWLGIQCWRQAGQEHTPDTLAQARLSGAQLFRGGLWIGLSNPKFLLFVSAFLPQFINPAAAQTPQWLVLIATMTAGELFWYAVYALGGHGMRRCLQTPRAKRGFDRVSGVIFISFAALLLRAKPQ